MILGGSAILGLVPIASACDQTTALEKEKQEQYQLAVTDLNIAEKMVTVSVKTDVEIKKTFPSAITMDNLDISGVNTAAYDLQFTGAYKGLNLGVAGNDEKGTLKVTLLLQSKAYKDLRKLVTRELGGFRKAGDVIEEPKPIPEPEPTPVTPSPSPSEPTPGKTPEKPAPSTEKDPAPKPGEKEPVNPAKPQPGNEPNPGETPQPDPKPAQPNPGDQPQPGPVNPPVMPPFVIPSFDPNAGVIQANTYPSYVTEYKTAEPQTMYEEIWNRTFSIRPAALINSEGENMLIDDQGTGWVLDYHKKDENNYKLFIATNMHVIGKYANTNSADLDKQLNYNDPTGAKPGGFALGKGNKPTSFASIANNSWAENIDQVGGYIKYYANNEELASSDFSPSNNTTYSTAFTNPKVLFAAVDYMDQTTYDQFADKIQSRWNGYKEYKQNEITNGNLDDETRKIYQNFINQKSDKIPFYTDFGVLELDVDLTKADATLKEWIKQAISGVDSYVARMKQKQALPNYDATSETFLPTLDYLSKGRDLSQSNSAFAKGLSNAKDLYIAGYPRNTSGRTIWMQNNPTERYSDEVLLQYNRRTGVANGIANNKLFDFATNDVESPIETGNIQIYSELWNRPYASFYGFNYNIKFSSLYYGASGSMVYNDFGELVGIYNGVAANAQFGDNMTSGTFAPLLQTADIQVPNNKFIYGYNLIDNTGYAHQTRSYRSNLKLFYPNGFDENGNKTTALFPKGF
ncbi:MIP family Ig-specific serine endopeptidase [Mycoplasma sp. 2634B]|uniref:MIP family Ig-specific serine endopeptidase n=1 Tax=Mycoplasma sp. 2634B TaxID=3401692 RepID=UPI003AAC1E75